MKTSKRGTKVKLLDYFRVYTTWQEFWGNGDTYECEKVFLVKAASVKCAIKEVTAQWKASKEYIWENFEIVSIEHISSSEIEMKLAIAPPMLKRDFFAIIEVNSNGNNRFYDRLFSDLEDAERVCFDLNLKNDGTTWHVVKQVTQTTEISDLEK